MAHPDRLDDTSGAIKQHADPVGLFQMASKDPLAVLA